MSNKTAFVTGITGQDGAYLSELLLEKGYQVHGLRRGSSLDNTVRLTESDRLTLHYGDLTDTANLFNLIYEIQPDEIYNLGAQSHVAISFESPEYAANTNSLGTLRLLEALRVLGMTRRTRFYQASSSELYGLVQGAPQTESTPFYPRSPYAVSKLYAYWITVNYRESYGLFGCNGILFNHESPLRAETFVTRKITRALGRLVVGLQKGLRLGNLNALRDWGHARDYVKAQWLMLQQEEPADYVVATGEQHTVREFVQIAAKTLGVHLRWEGVGLEERGVIEAIDPDLDTPLQIGDVLVRVDPQFFRPAEVETLLGDSSKARNQMGWKPRHTFEQLVEEMVQCDLELAWSEARYDAPSLC